MKGTELKAIGQADSQVVPQDKTAPVWKSLLGTCQIDKGNLHERRSAECMGFGEAISNITLELKP